MKEPFTVNVIVSETEILVCCGIYSSSCRRHRDMLDSDILYNANLAKADVIQQIQQANFLNQELNRQG